MDSEFELDIDVQRMCRLCLAVDEKNLKNFFCSDILDGAIVAFPKIYEQVTEIEAKKDDTLPQGICVTCKAKTSEFYLFKQRCINSNSLLCKILDVPVAVKSNAKPSQTDQCTQSTSCDRRAFGTQTVDEEDLEPKQMIEYYDYVSGSNPNEKSSPVKIVQESGFKREMEHDIEEFVEQESVEAEDYILGYENSEYLSPEMYVINDECSTVEGNEGTYVEEKMEYKIETVEHENIEELDMLDVTETYSVILPRKPTTSKRSKKTTETCNICKIELKSSVINSHRNLHQQTLPMILDSIPYFRCGRCKTVFPDISQMESHFDAGSCCTYIDEPTDCTDYQYLEDFPECDTEEGGPFSGCRTLRLSSVMQTTDDTFSCELCYNFSSSNVNDILDHCVKHFSNDKENNVVYYDEIMPGPHRCGVCQLSQPSLSAALRHVFFHSTTFICPIKDCDDKFTEFKCLSGHIERQHMAKENVKHQRCMHCGEISESYQAFRHHQRKVCEKKIYRCDVCAKKFFHKSSLSMHMKYHLKARFTCEVCNKAFSQLCDYKVHYRIHSGEKPYKCEYEHCDKSFRSISNRKDHMSTHRTEKMFTCEICSQTFKSERTLRGHYPIHNPTKKFQCDAVGCGKSFHRRFHLTLHLKSHDKKYYQVNSGTAMTVKR